MVELAWYEHLRREYQPKAIRLLLIGESPPDPGDGAHRFFYSSVLSQHDNLYRGVALALYGLGSKFDITQKASNLRRMQDDGVWLIDAIDTPVNKEANSTRRRRIRAAVPSLVSRCKELAPTIGVLICFSPVYEEAAQRLREAGVTVVHDAALPFPLGNLRAQFVEGTRLALSRTGWVFS